jgi:replication factor C subunit 2/4
MAHLWKLGYAAEDIIGNIFRVTKSMNMSEELKLDFIKVDTIVMCRQLQIVQSIQSRVKTIYLTHTGDHQI